MKINSIEIQARRWFQKSFGNTYFAGELYINDQLAVSIDFQYGYDDQCVVELINLAIKDGKLPPKTEKMATWQYLDSICPRDQQIINIIDVKRKKDL